MGGCWDVVVKITFSVQLGPRLKKIRKSKPNSLVDFREKSAWGDLMTKSVDKVEKIE